MTNTPEAGHGFYEHVNHQLGEDVLVPTQEQYGGYAFLNSSNIVARSPITGLRPVVEQAIAQTKASFPNLTGDALESKIALKLTQLNDWAQLTQNTQNEIMILTGINFDGMTTAEQEATINHLLHSPLPFGDIVEPLSSNVRIDLGITHTLDKTKTTVEDLGEGMWKVTVISNNNNGSHTGHSLGSFVVNFGVNATASVAKAAGNAMIVNTNNNNQLYLSETAKDVLYGRIEELEFEHPEDDNSVDQGHTFVEHVGHRYGDSVLIETQEQYGGSAYINDSTIVGRSTITALQPVVEQAIDTIKKANPTLTGEALEQKIAQKITELNDWAQLTEETQGKLMILTGIDIDSMSAADQEKYVNHLLHSPLPFGKLGVVDTDVTIDLGFTHTLDKTKTVAEHLGDGIYEVSMISNNNNGSHTGHNLGSFKLDLSDYPAAGSSQFASSASATSNINSAAYNASRSVIGAEKTTGEWYSAGPRVGDVTMTTGFASAKYASELKIHSGASYGTGHVKKIELQDTDGNWHTVWTGSQNSTKVGARYENEFSFAKTDYLVKAARFVMDTNKTAQYSNVDAVELVAPASDENDSSGLESKAIAFGNDMVKNTNNNAKLYLDDAAKDVLYGRVDRMDFDMDSAYENGEGDNGVGEYLIKNNNHATQTVNGTTDNDVFVSNGDSSDYTWTKTGEDTYTIYHKNHAHAVDTLQGVETLRFNDRDVDISENDGGGNDGENLIKDNAAKLEYVEGTTDNDVFVIDSDSADYGWEKTADGTAYVVWSGAKFDILTGIETLRFNDRDVDISGNDGGDNGGGGNGDENLIDDVANETQYVNGTTDNDVFVIDSNAADYGWGETADGTSYVVWSGDKFDILSDVETIRFNDRDVNISGNDGGSNDNEFVVDGNSSDYGWGLTEDGNGIVLWNDNTFEVLEANVVLKFNDKSVDTSSLFEDSATTSAVADDQEEDTSAIEADDAVSDNTGAQYVYDDMAA